MVKRDWGKRIISLVLALELFMSPVAMARAADPAHVLALPETPLGEEVLTQDLPAEAADLGQEPSEPPADPVQTPARVLEGNLLPYSKVYITKNLSWFDETEWRLSDFSEIHHFRLDAADDLINVEITGDENELAGTLWFDLGFAKDTGYVDFEEGARYTYLPNLKPAVLSEDVDEYGQPVYLRDQGEYRVPDMRFDAYAMVTMDEMGRVDRWVRPLYEDGLETQLDEELPGTQWMGYDYNGLFGGQLVELQNKYDTVVGDAANEFGDNYLPIAAWFVPSDIAMLTALDITSHGSMVKNTDLTKVYTQDPLKVDNPKTLDLTDFTASPEGNAQGTEFGAKEMWIQVGSDQTSLDLHFQTFEPYYSYTKDDGPSEDVLCPINITYSMNGGSNLPLDLSRSDVMECQFLPRPAEYSDTGRLRGTNSMEDKARGDWVVKGIPLVGTGTDSSPTKVDIVLTVTAPNGIQNGADTGAGRELDPDEIGKETYILHVQRRQSVEDTGALAYGNTPFGMIQRDDGDKWDEEITKELAQTRFVDNGFIFSDIVTRPTGPVNQNGGIYYKWPYTACWPSGKNVDQDPLAVVAYQDMVFQDPGVAFTDSFGRPVDLNNALYRGSVKRTIELKTPKSGTLSANSWTLADTSIDPCWYTVENGKAKLSNTKVSQTLTSMTQEVDLRGLPVLPGIYEIVYNYTDPCSDATAASGGPTYTAEITRTLVVLPIPGDVDMDGAVTSADAYELKNNLELWGSGSGERLRLARGRVFDLNGNGTLEAQDYLAILNDGYQPEVLRTGPVSDYFYIPLPDGNAGYQRKTWDDLQDEQVTGNGTISLEFLGVEQGTRNGDVTVSPKGPFAPKTEEDGSLTPVSLKNQETGEDNSVFWMGVKLKNSPLEGDYIEGLTVSLTYDSRYVEPTQVYTAAEKNDYEGINGPGSFDGWTYSLRNYNMRDPAGADVIWKGYSNAYVMTGSVAERSYRTHYSKVIGELEEERDVSSLRELVVSLRYDSTAGHAVVGDGYLLVLPFKLKSHPPKEVITGSDARLIELGAGMRDLTFVTRTPESSFMAFLFSLGRATAGEVTSAFSAQEDIYGGSTQNLRDGLNYDTEAGEVPIGPDNTTREVLIEGTYGEKYGKNGNGVNGVGLGANVSVIEGLPPGLTYVAAYTRIEGTPLLPGEYDFEINTLRYKIIIKPKTIQYRPRNADSYYGEAEYRGTVAQRAEAADLRNFEFEYNAKDLAESDRTYARSLGIDLKTDPEADDWRNGKELALILNRQGVKNPYNDQKEYDYTYTAPGFTALLNQQRDPVLTGSKVGDYTITTTETATSTCYALNETTTATLAVVKRPVYVDHINATAEDSGLSIYNDEPVSFSSRVLYDKGETTEIVLTLPLLDGQTVYGGRPLTGAAKLKGDRVAVTYEGQFLRDTSKGDTNTAFVLSEQSEERQVEALEVTTLRDQVTENGKILDFQSGNYMLVSTGVRHDAGKDNIKGIVNLRGVAELEMTNFPSELRNGKINYYGSKIENPEALRVRAVLGEGNSSIPVGEYQYNAPDLFPLLIHYNWVTPEEYEEGIKAENATPAEHTEGDRPVWVGNLKGTGVDTKTGEDTRPYGYSREVDPDNFQDGGYRNNYLYPDMNGWRVCACVTMYVGDTEAGQNVQYIKCYSDPITVLPKPLTLKVASATRYYGEELTAEQLEFSFSPSQLATRDSKGVIRGTSAALKMVFDRLDEEIGMGYKMPEFKMVDDLGNEVNKNTSIEQGRSYKIVLSGAENPCYDIQYIVTEVGKEDTESSVAGSAPLIILPRPIIVQSIRGNGADGSFTNIYADTKNLVVTRDPETKKLLEASGANVDFVLPRYDTEQRTTSYYLSTSDGNMYTEYGVTFHEPTEENPEFTVVAGDDVRVRYQARFLPDAGRYTWGGFTQGFFDNEPIAASPTGYLDKYVQVERMELVGAQSGNYLLVYADDVSFIDRVPADAVTEENTHSAPANNDQALEKNYYVSGSGRVYMRPIEGLVITKLGQMTYIYGDQFAPGQPGTAGEPMTLRVEYATTYDNDPDNNVHTEEVRYEQSRVDEEGNRISTFADRGFTIYYVKPGQSRSEAEALNQILTNGVIMTPSGHHGATLFVTGKRSAGDDLMYSVYDDAQAEEPIQVERATLTLTAANAHKFYGEDNPTGDYTFTFDTRELAPIDQDALKALNGGTLAREGTKADLARLDAGADFSKLLFTTPATKTSPVGENGKWGEYDLKLTASNASEVLSNYNVVTQNAHLYIYPRPVRVTGINSSPLDPVYTVFNEPTTFTFTTELSTAPREDGRSARVVVEHGAILTGVYPVTGADNQSHDLPLTGDGMVEGDNLVFVARVEFPKNWNLDDAADLTMGVRLTIQTLKNSDIARNYNLLVGQGESFGELDRTDESEGSVVWGSAKLRTIRSLSITRPPYKMEYTYGEALDLTGLQVRVGYARMDQETGALEEVTVDYYGPDQFQSMGLYVNYWTPGEELPVDNALRRALPSTYWRADTGDHLTIAPNHTTQRYLTNPGAVPKEKPFAANGKYLVISGFQIEVEGEHNKQEAAAPVILGAYSDVTGHYEEQPYTPIKVNPRKVSFTLSAEDKTYDGDVKTAGSVTLTNVYDPGPDQDIDVIYLPFGATYEAYGMDHSKYTSFKENVLDGRVTFTTGAYTPNGAAPLLENGKITWASGYTWGTGLTFTFPNANVHYVDDSGVSGVGNQVRADYWRASQPHEAVTDSWDNYKAVTAMPVEVTNMVLAGPDAANYTWEWNSEWEWDATNSHRVPATEVLMTTRSAAVDGQAATPFATIHKANRSTIQESWGSASNLVQLSVDRATNVVRLYLIPTLAAMRDNNNTAEDDEFRDELHFEYALLYAAADEDGNPTGLLAQWAGRDGQKAYQDTTFFGGEAVTPTPTAEGYRPNLDRLPKSDKRNEKTIFKGQIYQWAAEDNGVATVGGYTVREDSGFVFNPAAFPGGATLVDKNGNVVKAEDAFWYYTLYTTDRVNLPRNTVFYPLVRLAETHNYNASGNLSGDERVTAELLDAAQKALADLAAEETEETLDAAKAASQAVLNAAQGMKEEALAASKAQMDADAAQGENNRWPEEQPSLEMGPASAIKTLTQRLDLLSASTERSQTITGAPNDTTDYLVELLEAVWFTDTLVYAEEKFFSAAVYNHPTRYYGYFWNVDMNAKLEFREKALDFTEEILVPVRVRQPNGSVAEEIWTLNTVDETVGGRVAKIYVQIEDNSSKKVHKIQIMPTVLYARLGDAPYQLTWIAEPEKPSNRRFTWTSSDPSVATVDENGLVVFRGVGTCTITLATDNNKFSTITVTVSEYLPLVQVAQSLFDFYHNAAWMELDENGNFYPHAPMTRGQVVELLDLFLDPDAQWAATDELAYVDVTGEEKYADALRRMTGAGVVVGLPGSAFGGERLISRAEFATMVARMLRLEVPDTKGRIHQFIDAGEEDTWAWAYIDALAMTGVTKGTGNGTFNPNRILTREEAAVILARLLTVKLDLTRPGLKTPADMTPANWSYEYVLQAVNTIAFPAPTVTPPEEN